MDLGAKMARGIQEHGQLLYLIAIRCLEPFWHDQLPYLYVISAIMA